MKKILSIFTMLILVTLLSSCSNASLNKSNKKSSAETSSVGQIEIPFSIYSNYDDLATNLINSDSIEGIKINTTYKNILSKYGEPTTKSDEIVQGNSSVTKQIWYYDNDNIEFYMVKVQNEYVVNAIRIYGKSNAATERDIKIGSPANDVIKAYSEEINGQISEDSIIVAGVKNKGMTFMLKEGKVNSILFGTT